MFPVRPIKPDDAKAVLELTKELYIYHRCVGNLQPNEQRFRIQVSQTGNPRIYGYIAHSWKQPIGYCLYHIDGYCSAQNQWQSLRLSDWFVNKEYRKQGVGRALLSEVARAAIKEGVERITLQVHKGNGAACALYEKLDAHEVTTTAFKELALGKTSLERILNTQPPAE